MQKSAIVICTAFATLTVRVKVFAVLSTRYRLTLLCQRAGRTTIGMINGKMLALCDNCQMVSSSLSKPTET